MQSENSKLWTKDFTILIIGSFVSLAGSSAIIYALGISILDISHSNFLYSLTLVISNVAGISVPLIAAAFLERKSKRKLIYRLDFLNAIMLFCMAIVCKIGWMSVPAVFFYCLVFGVVNNLYKLAYESYLPKLVSSELYTKAYSISSIIITIADASVLVGTFCYDYFGIFSVLLVSGILYFIAACFECKIEFEEDLSDIKASGNKLVVYINDIKNIFEFLLKHKGLLALCAISFVLNFCQGAFYAVVLPFFKFSHHSRLSGEYIYIIVMSFLSTGEFWGGTINYYLKIKPKFRERLFVFCAIIQLTLTCLFVYVPLGVMMAMMFLAGIATIMAHTVRSATLYSNVPSNLMAKFTGFLQGIMCLAYVLGSLMSGAVSEFLSIGTTLAIANGVALCAFVLIFALFGKDMRSLFRYDVGVDPDEVEKLAKFPN